MRQWSDKCWLSLEKHTGISTHIESVYQVTNWRKCNGFQINDYYYTLVKSEKEINRTEIETSLSLTFIFLNVAIEVKCEL